MCSLSIGPIEGIVGGVWNWQGWTLLTEELTTIAQPIAFPSTSLGPIPSEKMMDGRDLENISWLEQFHFHVLNELRNLQKRRMRKIPWLELKSRNRMSSVGAFSQMLRIQMSQRIQFQRIRTFRTWRRSWKSSMAPTNWRWWMSLR